MAFFEGDFSPDVYMKRELGEDKGFMIERHGTATGVIRRPFATTINRRFAKVYKALKVSSPLHMFNWTTASLPSVTIGSIGAATTILQDIHAGIAQGDAYNERFGTVTRTVRLRGQFTINPGSASVSAAAVRFTIFRAQVGTTAAAAIIGLDNSANPIANNTISQVFLDRRLQCPATLASVGFPCVLRFSVKLKNFRLNYSGSAAATQTGESIFMLFQSNQTSTLAPVLTSGNAEVWFHP